MKTLFKKLNIFTVLVIVVTLALALRLNAAVDTMGTDKTASSNVSFATAGAQQTMTDEAPPEDSPEDQFEVDNLKMFDNENGTVEDRIQQDRGLPEFPIMTFSDTEIEVLQSLSKRREALEKRERQLVQKEALLNAAEQEVDNKIKELASLKKELEVLLDQQEKTQEERLRRMVKIYENMKPKEAAAIFNSLDMDVLLSVISRMSERKSAPIFANMNPARAQDVTIRLVEQSQLPQVNLE